MLAVALLPINKDTLRYGSNDGGFTVRADHPILCKKMEVHKRTNSLLPFDLDLLSFF